jgi:hypothetical protein
VNAHCDPGKAFSLPLSPEGDAGEWLFPLEKALLLYQSDLSGRSENAQNSCYQLEMLAICKSI